MKTTTRKDVGFDPKETTFYFVLSETADDDAYLRWRRAAEYVQANADQYERFAGAIDLNLSGKVL